MIGHGSKFDQKKELAIAALVSRGNVEEAARAVGISVNTLQRWMQIPEFKTALQEARQMVYSHAMGRLCDAAGAAATTVLKIMLDTRVRAGERLRAVEFVFEQAAKASEMKAIEDRVAKLERSAGLARKSRKRSAGLTCLTATPLPGPAKTPAQIAAPPPDTAPTDEDDDE